MLILKKKRKRFNDVGIFFLFYKRRFLGFIGVILNVDFEKRCLEIFICDLVVLTCVKFLELLL